MDTLDWVADTTKSYYHTADEIMEKTLAFGKNKSMKANGAVILMHLGTQRINDFPHKNLPLIIRQMKKRGYSFMTISGLL